MVLNSGVGMQLRDLLLDLVFQNTQIIGILWKLCQSDVKGLSQRQLKVLPGALQQVLACRGHQRLATFACDSRTPDFLGGGSARAEDLWTFW